MSFSRSIVIIAWIMTALLLANSFVILINIFDFPPTGLRHFISFTASAGVLAGLLFIVLTILRFFDISGWR